METKGPVTIKHTYQRDPEVLVWPSVFGEAWGTKAFLSFFFVFSPPDRNTATVASRDASEVEVREAHSQVAVLGHTKAKEHRLLRNKVVLWPCPRRRQGHTNCIFC